MTMPTVDLVQATIGELAPRIARREVSPVEITLAAIERTERLQPLLTPFVTFTPEYALERARAAEREIMQGRYRGPLHGIPYTLKDVIATAGIRTTWGDPKGVDYRPAEHATVHSLMEEAGAILMGKVVSEIGRSSINAVGARNAWDLTRSPGTSSSGSGSATAASLCLASIGTDTGGSVRHPASNSSLVGMKATFGRISRFGVWASSWSQDQAGPITKTVEDNAILMNLLGRFDPKDPTSLVEPPYDHLATMRDGIRGVRIGVPVDDWAWSTYTTEEEEQVCRRAIDQLAALGASIIEVRMPRAGESRANSFSLSAETPVYISDHFSQEQIDAWPDHHSGIANGLKQPFADYLHAQQARGLIKQEVNLAFQQADVIAFPTGSTYGDTWDAETSTMRGRTIPARSRAVYRNGMASMCGIPALSVPAGFGHDEQWPIGLQLHGRPLEEALLYRVAYSYEQATPWHNRHPNI